MGLGTHSGPTPAPLQPTKNLPSIQKWAPQFSCSCFCKLCRYLCDFHLSFVKNIEKLHRTVTFGQKINTLFVGGCGTGMKLHRMPLKWFRSKLRYICSTARWKHSFTDIFTKFVYSHILRKIPRKSATIIRFAEKSMAI